MKRQLSNAVNRLHARVILLSRGGVRNAEIAQRCGCSPCWVRQIIHRFDEGGIDAITWYPYYCHRAGPRKFLADVTEQIAEVALSPPQQLIGMSVWSLPKLREYLLAQQVVASISIERLRQVLHVVLANAGFHKKAEVLAYAAAHRIELYFTPTGASWLNRIECHFAALRKFALDNTDYRTHEDLQAVIDSYLAWRNGTREISITNWQLYRRQHKKAG